jgi:hypothetical protein
MKKKINDISEGKIKIKFNNSPEVIKYLNEHSSMCYTALKLGTFLGVQNILSEDIPTSSKTKNQNKYIMATKTVFLKLLI